MDVGDWIRHYLPLLDRAIINPIMLSFAGRPYIPVGIIQHIGRRSGTIYLTPVLPQPYKDGFLIALPYARDTDWCLNVCAAGEGYLVYQGAAYPVHDPQLLGEREDAAALRALFPCWIEALYSAVHTGDFLYVVRADNDAPAVYRQVTPGHPVGYVVLVLTGILLMVGLLRRGVRRRPVRPPL